MVDALGRRKLRNALAVVTALVGLGLGLELGHQIELSERWWKGLAKFEADMMAVADRIAWVEADPQLDSDERTRRLDWLNAKRAQLFTDV